VSPVFQSRARTSPDGVITASRGCRPISTALMTLRVVVSHEDVTGARPGDDGKLAFFVEPQAANEPCRPVDVGLKPDGAGYVPCTRIDAEDRVVVDGPNPLVLG
jgi:hypothetical protein